MAPTKDPETIRQARKDNPGKRPIDLARQLGISEAEYVAAHIGHGATRVTTDFARIFPALASVGEVMALTRNASAVHEKIGVYDNFIGGKHAAMMLGEKIDTRMFPAKWVQGFAVETPTDDGVRRSLQFFDGQGTAVHKVHARTATDLDAWAELVGDIALEDQTGEIAIEPLADATPPNEHDAPVEALRQRWNAMTDTHQFVGILRDLGISRRAAVRNAGPELAWRIANDAVNRMMTDSARENLPIMCFVGNRGCIQIHSGPISTLREMGPWLNVMDADFHLHLRLDHIAETWAVRKPTDRGHVTSLEAYDADGALIIQFFGKRIEGQDERSGWRRIMEDLPRLDEAEVA